MFRIRKVNKKNIAEEIKSGDIVQHFKRTDDMQANEYLYRIIAEASIQRQTNIWSFIKRCMAIFRPTPAQWLCFSAQSIKRNTRTQNRNSASRNASFLTTENGFLNFRQI